MDRPWINEEHEPARVLKPDALPMSQEEALRIIRAVAVTYATDRAVAGQLEDRVAGWTDDFDN
jgi:hypothetical protein